MDTTSGTSEIVEAVEQDSEFKLDENAGKHHIQKPRQKYTIEDDINRLFESIDIRTSRRGLDPLQQNSADTVRKNAMKRPIKSGLSQASGIGISESVSLKQALRGLCISQASEMAAMKRLKKPSRLSGFSEDGAIKKLYRAVVVEASEAGHPLNEGKGNLVEISLVPERNTSNFSENIPESQHVSNEEKLNRPAHPFTENIITASTQKAQCGETVIQEEIVPLPSGVGDENLMLDSRQDGKLKYTHSLFPAYSSKKLPVLDENLPASVQFSTASVVQDKELEVNLHSAASQSSSKTGNKVTKFAGSGSCLIRPVFRSRKFKSGSNSVIKSSDQCHGGGDNDLGPSTSKRDCHTPDGVLKKASREMEKASPSSCSTNVSIEVSSSVAESNAFKPGLTSSYSGRPATLVAKTDERSRSREKGEFSQSSKSSIGEVSSSTSFSEESNLSGSGRSGHRPHMSKDLRWEAIHCVQKQHGSISLRHFKLLRKLGGGDIGTVYLAELIGTNCLFALKIMDNEFLAIRKKMSRAQTEREILQMLDHPFLPTLFSHFTTDKFSCLVMEYCPGGDLHVLRQKQAGKSFSEEAARFYVAEVLLALEYLHMLGVVYRDLKPENILVREDGHIMLSDFDLSLRCAVKPTLVKSPSPAIEPPKRVSSPCAESSCIEPFCLQPSCFTPRLLSAAAKARKLKSDLAAQINPLPQLVVEPTSARSNSFVGTHEYLSPEIIKGQGHGNAVDWWTFGIFLYELLYGRTPFKGPGNEDTLTNVVSQSLKLPESPIVSLHARDLIRRLLQKEPGNRLGSMKGAAEIKQHPFFEGLNWALIRCATPPELPRFCDYGSVAIDASSQNKEDLKSQKDCSNTGEDSEFEMF